MMLGEVRGRWMGGRLLTAFFVAVLVAGAMSSGIAIAGAGPSGTIAVSSDPSGATVKVDNVVRGVTPLELRDLTPGAHRVAVAKAGYLENMRVVQVTSGGTLNVDVRLTSTSLPAQETTTAVQAKSGGSKLKWLLIGGGGAGAAVAYVLLTRNSPPVVSSITITPSVPALAGVSLSFTSNASDPNGDALTSNWDFGDGGSATSSNPTHVYNSGGNFNATVTVSDGKATASTSQNVRIGDVVGSWYGAIAYGSTPSCSTNWLQWTLSRSGSGISGQHVDATNGYRTITGNVSGSLNMTITLSSGVVYTGTVNSAFTQYSGTVTGYGGVTQNFVICKN